MIYRIIYTLYSFLSLPFCGLDFFYIPSLLDLLKNRLNIFSHLIALAVSKEKFGEFFCVFPQNRMTHVLTHNRIAPSGQSSIFQNSMSTNSEKTQKFSKLLKRIYLRPPGFSLDVQNLFQRLPPALGEVLLVYFVLLGAIFW